MTKSTEPKPEPDVYQTKLQAERNAQVFFSPDTRTQHLTVKSMDKLQQEWINLHKQLFFGQEDRHSLSDDEYQNLVGLNGKVNAALKSAEMDPTVPRPDVEKFRVATEGLTTYVRALIKKDYTPTKPGPNVGR